MALTEPGLGEAEGMEEEELEKVPTVEDISVYQVPWDRETSEKFHRRDDGHVVVITNQELTPAHMNDLRTGVVMQPNRIYKNRYDRFNGKYIIEALRNAPVVAEKKKEFMGGEGEEMAEEEEEEPSDEESDEGEGEEHEEEQVQEEAVEPEDIDENDMNGDYDLNSDSGESTDVYTTILKVNRTPMTEQDRLLIDRLEEMEIMNARRLKRDINLLKLLFKRYYKLNTAMGEEFEEEEEEYKVGEEYKFEDEEERETLPVIPEPEHDFYEDGEEPGEGEDEDDEEDEGESDQSDTDELKMSQVNLTLYDDLVSLYEMDSYYITDLDIKHLDGNVNALKDYDFPMGYYDYYNEENVKALSFMEYKHLLDYLDGPLPKYHKAGTLSLRSGFKSGIGALLKASATADEQPTKKQPMKIKFNEINRFGEYEKLEMIMKGELLPKHLQGPAKLPATFITEKMPDHRQSRPSIAFSNVSNTSFTHTKELKIPIGDPNNPSQYAVVHRALPVTGGSDLTLPKIIQEYKRFELPLSDEIIPPYKNIFQIISTVSVRPDLQYILGKCNDESKFFILRTCGIVIFDISRSRHDIAETWYYLKQYIELLDKKELSDTSTEPQLRHLILITNFFSWAKSDPNVRKNINEENFLNRKCHPDYMDYYALENFVYKIGQNTKFRLKTTIIFSGIPYGHEQDVLLYFFKLAWDNETEIPLWTAGKNILPLIHIDDLAQVVVKTVNEHHYPPIVFAVSPNTNTLIQIAKAIVKRLSGGRVIKLITGDYTNKMCIPKIIYDLLRLNIRHDNVEGAAGRRAKFANPFENAIKEVIQELKAARNLGEVTILLLGPPSKIKFEIAVLLSKFYELPIYHKDNIIQKYIAMMEALRQKEPKEEEEENEEEEPVGEEEEQKNKEIDPEILALKRVIDNKSNNVNNQWLAKCLKKLLTSVHVKNHGYILVDFPVREKDALYLFANERVYKAGGAEEEEESDMGRNVNVTFPEYIFLIDGSEAFVHKEYFYCHSLNVKTNDDLINDLDEYIYFRNTNQSVRDYVERKNFKVYPFNVVDGEEMLNKMLAIIGPPKTNNGSLAFCKYIKHIHKFNPIDNYTALHRKNMERYFDEAEGILERSIDRPYGERAYSLREFYLCNPAQQFFARERYDVTPIQEIMRSKTWGYNAARRHWGNKSAIFRELPSSHPRQYWKALRSFWF